MVAVAVRVGDAVAVWLRVAVPVAGTAVLVADAVEVEVPVAEGDRVGLAVGAFVDVLLAVDERVADAVRVGLGRTSVGLAVAVTVTVAVGVVVRVALAVELGLNVAVVEAVDDAVGVADLLGVGVAVGSDGSGVGARQLRLQSPKMSA